MARDLYTGSPLKGLRGFSELSGEERNAFFTRFPDAKRATPEQLEIGYKNQQFIERFGEDAFNKIAPEDRDTMYKQAVVGDAFTERYGEGETLSPELSNIHSADAMMYLLENNYKTVNERDLEEQERLKSIEEASDIFAADPEMSIIGLGAKRGAKISKAAEQRSDASILEDAILKENDSVKKSASMFKDYFDAYNVNEFNTNQNYSYEVEQQFNELMNKKTETGAPLFPYWDAFKDSYQLADWGPEKKANLLSQFNAILAFAEGRPDEEKNDLYERALDIVNKEFQHEIHENTTFIDKAVNTDKAILTKTVSSVAQTMLGVHALAEGIKDAFDGGNRLQNYLAGRDEEGNELSPFLTMKYYSNMDSFNTWSPEEQKSVELRGGITPSLNIKDTGEEYKWFTTESLLDARAMLGYEAASLGIDYLTLGGGKFIKGTGRLGARALKGLGVSMRDIAKVHQILDNPITEALGTIARTQIHSVSESVLEGMGVYDQVLAERQALKDKELESPETKEQIENQIEERVNQLMLLPENQTLRMTYDKEGKPIGAVPTIDREAIYNQARQQVIDEWNAREDDAIEKAATNAFVVEATTKQLKNSIGDAVFKQYMYAKPIKFNTRGRAFHASDVELTDAGTLAAKKLTAGDYTKKALKTVLGGGLDEYSDEWLNQGALAFGLTRANDYTQQATDPDNTMLTSNWYAGLQSYMSGVDKALFDPSSLQQMFVGAISPVTNVTVNPAGIRRTISSIGKYRRGEISKDKIFADRENDRKFTKAETLNEIFTSPVYGEAIDSYREYIDLERSLSAVNDVIEKHGEDFKSIIPSIMNLKNYLDAQTSRNTLEQKDAQNNLAFQTLKFLDELSLAADVSPLYNDYMGKLEAAANGDITNEDIQAFLNADGNKDLISTLGQDNAERVAREAIQDNAEKLIKEHDTYQEVSNLIDSYYGNDLSRDVKDALIFNALKESDWRERISQMEESLTERTQNNGKLFGARKDSYIKDLNESYDNQITRLNELIEESSKVASESTNRDERKLAEKTIKKAKAKIAQLNKDKNTNNSYDYRVLTAEEIINSTTSLERASMLSLPEKYTDEQQIEINRAKDILSKEDPAYLEHVVDIASLQNRLNATEGSFREILEDIDGYRAYNIAVQNSNIAMAITRQQQTEGEALYEALKANPNVDEVMSQMIGTATASSIINSVDRVIKNHPEYEESLKEYKDVAQYKKDAADVINTFDIDQAQKNILTASVTGVISNAKTKEEAVNAIESALDSDQVTEADKQVLNTIATKLEEIGYQRDATRIRNREEEKKRRAQAEEAKRLAEEAKKGSNFGWDGYKSGSTVYTLDSKDRVKSGYVVGFEKDDKGNGIMKVRWSTPKGKREPITLYSALTDKNKISQSIPNVETLQDVTLDSGAKPTEGTPTVTPSGNITSTTPPTVEPQKQADEQPLSDVDPEEAANKDKNVATDFQGNGYYRYESGKVQKKRVGASENDAYNQVFNWLDNHSINLQEIVDNELGLILRRFPSTQIHWMRKKIEGTQQSDKVAQTMFNVIEYTPEIQKSGIHKDDRGGIIEFNNKQWLIVGTTLFNEKESSESTKQNFFANRDRTGSARSVYFQTHPDELYWVDENAHTIVTDFRAGNITKQLLNDQAPEIRSLGDLLYNADGSINLERNPLGLTWENISFGIVVGGKIKPIRVPERLIPYVHSPRAGEALNGSAYIMIPGAGQDRLIPVMINPTMVEELKEGSDLKEEIYRNYMELTSKDFAVRKAAQGNLWELLDIGSERPDTILIGDADKPVLTFVKNGAKIATYDLSKPIDRGDLMRTISTFNPRVNLTTSILGNPKRLKVYSEAGALNTDVAKLGMSNASYSVAKVDSITGDPIIDRPIERKPAPDPTERHNLDGREVETPAIPLGNTYYRFRKGKWYTATDEEVTDSKTITSLTYNQVVAEQQLSPLDVGFRESKYNYYALSSNPEAPIVIKVNKVTKEADAINPTRSLEILNKVREIAAQRERERAAREANRAAQLQDVELEETQQTGEGAELTGVEDISFEGEEASVTQQVANEMIGETQQPPVQEPVKPTTQPPVSKKVTKSKYNVLKREKKEEKSLQIPKGIITFDAIMNDMNQSEILFNIGAEKFGWTEDVSIEKMRQDLIANNITVDNISDFDTWIDIIKNCR